MSTVYPDPPRGPLPEHDRLELVLQVNAKLVENKDWQGRLNDVVHLVARAVGSLGASLFLFDRDRRFLCLQATTGVDKPRVRYARNQGLTGWVGAAGRSVLSRDPSDRAALERGFPGIRFVKLSSETFPAEWDTPVRPFMAVPVRCGKWMLGVLRASTSSKLRACFTEEERMALELVGCDLAFAIRNRALSHGEKVKHRTSLVYRATLEGFTEVAGLVAAQAPAEKVLGRLTEVARVALRADWAHLNLVTPSGDSLCIAAVAGKGWTEEKQGVIFPNHQEKSASGYVLQTQSRYLIDKLASFHDIPDDMARLYRPVFPDIESALIVPVTYGGTRYGVLGVAARRLYAFNEADVRRLTMVADEAAVTLEVTRLIRRLLAFSKEKVDYLRTIKHQFTACLSGIHAHAANIRRHKALIGNEISQALHGIVSISRIMQTLVDNYGVLASLLSEDEGDRRRVTEGFTMVPQAACSWLGQLARDCEPLGSGKGIGVRVDTVSFSRVGAQDAAILIDKKLAYQALWAVIENALRYGEKRKDIEIACAAKDGNSLLLAISNYADGSVVITDDIRETIFDPGFRSRAARRKVPLGTGLGLWFARKVIRELHGGDIWADPTDERGITRFCVRFRTA